MDRALHQRFLTAQRGLKRSHRGQSERLPTSRSGGRDRGPLRARRVRLRGKQRYRARITVLRSQRLECLGINLRVNAAEQNRHLHCFVYPLRRSRGKRQCCGNSKKHHGCGVTESPRLLAIHALPSLLIAMPRGRLNDPSNGEPAATLPSG